MTHSSVVLMGGPDSGKTNYVLRLWHALDAKKGRLISVGQPDELGFLLDGAEYLFGGQFAPRTEHTEDRRDLKIPVAAATGGEKKTIVLPDISGELWRTAVLESEIERSWMEELERASGAVLFVRVHSDLNVHPLDWVVSQRLLQRMPPGSPVDEDRTKLPTQVMLCELVRFLELTMAENRENKPKLAIIVAAWDRVNDDDFEAGPAEFISKEYPMLAGRIADCSTIETRVFGLSIVGGDLKDDAEFRERYLNEGLDSSGWVAVQDPDGSWRKEPDLTFPLAWIFGA